MTVSGAKPVKAGLVSKFNAVADGGFLACLALSFVPYIGLPAFFAVGFLPLASLGLGAINTGIDGSKFIFANKATKDDSTTVVDLKSQFRKSAGFATLTRAGSVASYTAGGFFIAAAVLSLGVASGVLGTAALLSGATGAGLGLLARRSENKMAAADAAIKAAQSPQPPLLS